MEAGDIPGFYTNIDTGRPGPCICLMGELDLVVMPALQIFVGGATGHGHGADYFLTDPAATCTDAAKCLLLTTTALLENQAEKAWQVIQEARPQKKTKEEYFALVDSLFLDGPAVTYEDGRAQVRWT